MLYKDNCNSRIKQILRTYSSSPSFQEKNTFFPRSTWSRSSIINNQPADNFLVRTIRLIKKVFRCSLKPGLGRIYIRQCRIFRRDMRYPAIKIRIIRRIRKACRIIRPDIRQEKPDSANSYSKRISSSKLRKRNDIQMKYS